jgi:hypothetical protein
MVVGPVDHHKQWEYRAVVPAVSPVPRTAAGQPGAATRPRVGVVTHDFAHWKDEIAWMSLYFTAAVWANLALCLA